VTCGKRHHCAGQHRESGEHPGWSFRRELHIDCLAIVLVGEFEVGPVTLVGADAQAQ